MVNQVDDCRIIERVMAGDREAYSHLVDRYYNMVYRICLNMAGNIPDAEELAHDSFVEAYLRLAQLNDHCRFPGWLKVLTLNVCRMWYRRNQQKFVELTDDLIPAVEDEPEDRSIYARMSNGLTTLSASHRLVLVLHYYENLSYEEIATFLEISIGTVMSRLYRARQALKEVMQQMDEYEDISPIPDEKFKEELQAEIAILLRMFHDEPNALERLTVVLSKAPERIAGLILNSEDPAGNLAILLPHLGSDAIDMVLECCFSDDEPGSSNALDILRRYASRCEALGHRDGMPDIASRDTYLILDRIINYPADKSKKARVIMNLLEACEQSCPAVLFMNVLLCYMDAALPLLLDRWSDESSTLSPWILQSLIRTGAQFNQILLRMLCSDDYNSQASGLAGFEAVAKSICSPWRNGLSREQYLNDLRICEKWPQLSIEDIGEELIDKLSAKTVNIAQNGPEEFQSQAVRILGYLGAKDCVPVIRECLSSFDVSTRIAAILALAELGDTISADRFMHHAKTGELPEKIAALTALGRLQIAKAEYLLVEMVNDSNESVREAAVAALGEMGTVSSEVVLRELMRKPDRKLQKLAAKAVFGGEVQRKVVMSDVDRRLAEKRRKVTPVAEISPDAAFRFGLLEMRSYDEKEITECIATVCSDYCATRRYLVELGMMNRSNGIYDFTETGKCMWRVEQYIREQYLDQWHNLSDHRAEAAV